MRGTPTGAPPVPAGRGCRRPACGAPAQLEAAAARAAPVRTRNAGTPVRTHRTGSLAPTPAACRAAAARAAGCSMRSHIHGKAAVSPAGTTRWPGGVAQNIQSGTGSARRRAIRGGLGAAARRENGLHLIFRDCVVVRRHVRPQAHAWPVSMRLILSPITSKRQKVRISPQVSLRYRARRWSPSSSSRSTFM